AGPSPHRRRSTGEGWSPAWSPWPRLLSAVIFAVHTRGNSANALGRSANQMDSVVEGSGIRAGLLATTGRWHRGRNRGPTRLVRLEGQSTRSAPRLCPERETEGRPSPRDRER